MCVCVCVCVCVYIYKRILRKSVEKIKVSLKSNNNNGTLFEDQYTFVIISQ